MPFAWHRSTQITLLSDEYSTGQNLFCYRIKICSTFGLFIRKLYRKATKKYKKTSQGEREYTPYLNSLRKVEMRTAPEKYGKFSAQLFYCTGFVVLYRSSSEIYTYCKCIQPLLINKFSYYHGTREVGVNHYTFCLCARLSYRTGFHFSAIFFLAYMPHLLRVCTMQQ